MTASGINNFDIDKWGRCNKNYIPLPHFGARLMITHELQPYLPTLPHLIRMSSLTDVTPLMLRATSTALFLSIAELTKPLS